ncbi:hypothetical protein SRABI106_04745 [Rahnella aquatilis]|nr:hypothetical protein SRABI106_04745 [Rahnella aquatilis]
MASQRQQVIPDSTRKQDQRLLIPDVIHAGAKHRIYGDQQRAEGNRGITLPQGPQQDESAG